MKKLLVCLNKAIGTNKTVAMATIKTLSIMFNEQKGKTPKEFGRILNKFCNETFKNKVSVTELIGYVTINSLLVTALAEPVPKAVEETPVEEAPAKVPEAEAIVEQAETENVSKEKPFKYLGIKKVYDIEAPIVPIKRIKFNNKINNLLLNTSKIREIVKDYRVSLKNAVTTASIAAPATVEVTTNSSENDAVIIVSEEAKKLVQEALELKYLALPSPDEKAMKKLLNKKENKIIKELFSLGNEPTKIKRKTMRKVKEDKKFIIDNMSIEEVYDELNRHYGVKEVNNAEYI